MDKIFGRFKYSVPEDKRERGEYSSNFWVELSGTGGIYSPEIFGTKWGSKGPSVYTYSFEFTSELLKYPVAEDSRERGESSFVSGIIRYRRGI